MRLGFLLALLSLWTSSGARAAAPVTLDKTAENYAKLVLALGEHDPDYVDAYYGPAEWKAAATAEKKPLAEIGREATAAAGALGEMPLPAEPMERLRQVYLQHQLAALAARVRLLGGTKMTFDEESRALYDAVAPTYPAEHFEKILAQLDGKIPGEGTLAARYEKWRGDFVIPKEKLDSVFQRAIAETRARTAAQIALPPDESFTVEYVTGKPWGGYNWYQGGYRSVIQVNTDLPIYIDRAIDLAAHEGYPGHHVYNVLLEKNLVRDRGWREFTVYPLFSPQSLIAEGSANFGKEVVFTPAERRKFEQEILWPAAGLDPERVDEYYAVQELVNQLGYAANEAARQMVDGKMSETEARAWLEKYALMDPARAQQRVKFIQRYRSYVINYNLGEDLVRHYLEARGGTSDQPQKRWREFAELLASPRLPSGLR